jgi:arylsulfatase
MRKVQKYPKSIAKVWVVAIFYIITQILIPCKAAQAQQFSHSRKPNIVIIFMDDMGYGDIEPFGGIDYKTPHIDKLASQGMIFTNFYAQPTCSASRAALLTGSQPIRVGIPGVLFPHSKKGLNPKEETIESMLKKEGYATGIVGKWNLGDAKKFLPLQEGFDMYLGLPYSNDMWPKGHRNSPPTRLSSMMPPLPLIDGNRTMEYIKTFTQMDSLTLKYTKRAVRFINRHKNKPFFLYFAHTMVHVPLFVLPRFRGKSKQGMYGDVMMAVDWSVGRVMQTLRKDGMAKNTLVIFTSDNGPWLNFGNRAGSAGGLREGKHTMFGGGMKEPAIMRWPGVIPKGTINNEIASTMDILPTLAKITGAPLPKNTIDGVNILPILKDPSNSDPRKYLIYDWKRSVMGVREGKWKLILPHKYESYEGVLPGKNGRGGPMRKTKIKLSLYNLRRDPGERYNVIEQHPKVVKRLMKMVKKKRKVLGDRIHGIPCGQCRPFGKITGKEAIYPFMDNGGKGKKFKPINWAKILGK